MSKPYGCTYAREINSDTDQLDNNTFITIIVKEISVIVSSFVIVLRWWSNVKKRRLLVYEVELNHCGLRSSQVNLILVETESQMYSNWNLKSTCEIVQFLELKLQVKMS